MSCYSASSRRRRRHRIDRDRRPQIDGGPSARIPFPRRGRIFTDQLMNDPVGPFTPKSPVAKARPSTRTSYLLAGRGSERDDDDGGGGGRSTTREEGAMGPTALWKTVPTPPGSAGFDIQLASVTHFSLFQFNPLPSLSALPLPRFSPLLSSLVFLPTSVDNLTTQPYLSRAYVSVEFPRLFWCEESSVGEFLCRSRVGTFFFVTQRPWTISATRSCL